MSIRGERMGISSTDRIRNFRSKIAVQEMDRIEREQRAKKPKTIQKGPRAIFIEKYKITGNFEKAKEALDESGYNSSRLEDEVYQSWIDEDCGR